MIWFALAAVAVPPASHSIVGAFGYVLGSTPGAKIASCEKNDYPDRTEMFVCPGDNFFAQTYVHTQRHLITIISSSRRYVAASAADATKLCMDDVWALFGTISEKYPRLVGARTGQPHTLLLSESLLDGYANGRTIELKCTDGGATLKGQSAVLWVTYTLSLDEMTTLNKLDDLDRLKNNGLDPSRF